MTSNAQNKRAPRGAPAQHEGAPLFFHTRILWAFKVIEEGRCTGSSALALLAMAKHADNTGVLWVPIQVLLRSTGITCRSALRRAIQKLIDADLVVLERQSYGGNDKPNRYRLRCCN